MLALGGWPCSPSPHLSPVALRVTWGWHRAPFPPRLSGEETLCKSELAQWDGGQGSHRDHTSLPCPGRQLRGSWGALLTTSHS